MQFLYTRPVTAFRWNSINFLLLSNRIPPPNGATCAALPIRMFARLVPTPLHSTPETRLEGEFEVARFPKTWPTRLRPSGASVARNVAEESWTVLRQSYASACASKSVENGQRKREYDLFSTDYSFISNHRTPSIGSRTVKRFVWIWAARIS